MLHELWFLFLFLPGVFLAARLAGRLPGQGPALVLAGASLLFCWLLDPFTAGFCCPYALGNLAGARLLDRRPSAWLAGLLVAANILVLGFYKYTPLLLPSLHPLGILAPMGLSFLAFRAISAVLEVKSGRMARFGCLEYLLYLLYFPTFLAGPIATFQEVGLQVEAARRPDWSDGAAGLAFLGVGLFKKMVLAASLAPFSQGAFQAASMGGTVHFVEAWGAALAYTFELYFDFSGYSDMAIGISRLFAVRLPANFDSPYRSASIREFWRRWHITLSRFLRDHLYIPLGGNRKGMGRTLANVLAVMGLCGLWHGAGWTFLVWGLLHGAFLAADTLWRARPAWLDPGGHFPRTWRALCRAATFLAVVLAWVAFRAATLDGALAMWKVMLTPVSNLLLPLGAPGTAPVPFEYLPGWRVFLLPEGILPHFAGWTQLGWLGACFCMVMALPNTQEWLAGLDPGPRPGQGSGAFPPPRLRSGNHAGTGYRRALRRRTGRGMVRHHPVTLFVCPVLRVLRCAASACSCAPPWLWPSCCTARSWPWPSASR